MSVNKNPYIEPFDYLDGYNESIEKLKNKPEAIMFDSLCYEIFFKNVHGISLMKELEDKILTNALYAPNTPNYEISCVHAEGMRQTVRFLKSSALAHDQRIKAEVNTK